MKLLKSVICICALISSAVSQENTTTIKLRVDAPSVLWNSTSSEIIEIQAEEGYQVQVDVVQFAMDGENDNYVTINSITDDPEETNEIMLTYTVSGQPSYLYNNNKLKVNYVGNNVSNHFVLQFTQVGEPVTTTTVIPTTSVEPMPSPAPQEKAQLTVFLYGRSAADFNDNEIKLLRKAIANMGTEYCDIQHCPLNGTITSRNVEIETLKMCSVMWEHYDTCVLLTFALPIVKLDYDENPLWKGYQLSESHLQILWDTYGSKYMNEMNLTLYSKPDINNIFTFRIIIFCVVIVLLIMLVLSMRYMAGKINKKRRKLSDTICIVDQSSDRISQQSLTPHYLQELPHHLTREQRAHPANYSDYKVAYEEGDDKHMSQPFTNQITISSDVKDLEDAHA